MADAKGSDDLLCWHCAVQRADERQPGACSAVFDSRRQQQQQKVVWLVKAQVEIDFLLFAERLWVILHKCIGRKQQAETRATTAHGIENITNKTGS
jgi:hypothetical protein